MLRWVPAESPKVVRQVRVDRRRALTSSRRLGGLRGPATEWTGPVVGRRSHWSFRDEGGGRRTSHVYIEVLPTDSFGDGFLPLADGTWVTIGGGSYTDGDGTDYVEINGHYAHGPTWEEIAGGSRAAAERYVARYERKRPRR